MEHLGADADLCAKAKLKAVGKSGGGVDIDCWLHPPHLKISGHVLQFFCDDSLRMSGVIAVDMGRWPHPRCQRSLQKEYSPDIRFRSLPLSPPHATGIQERAASSASDLHVLLVAAASSLERQKFPCNISRVSQCRFTGVADADALGFGIKDNIRAPYQNPRLSST